ncbi:EAL domain-containing protein, partial [Lysinibacillus sp. D4A3_S15]|uniref:EAL domain-containing protein n=1 Tax=Lysinibacillus sp. D4A3_S15 TaxID=2941227 RepID=UPI0037C98413
LGFLSPAIFIPVAESAGKVREIDVLVLETVLSWLAERQKLGKKLVKIAVNISPDHFYYTPFVPDTLKHIQNYGIE